jgi:uncharacterized membrane protein YfcA
MTVVLLCLVAFLASTLTFFSGFGLGTLLLPAFALFFPLPQAIAMTAVVHLLNGLFKLVLVGRHVDRSALLRFGAPALLAALAGAWLLAQLGHLQPLARYELGGRSIAIAPVKAVIGALLLLFAAIEFSPRLRGISFAPRWMPLGGALSGFFGGLSGMQGALRSAFLVRAGLSKEAFIGTGVAIAVLIDVPRIAVYAGTAPDARTLDWSVIVPAVLAAFAGAWLGNRYLKKATLPMIQRLIAILLVLVALGLISGLL